MKESEKPLSSLESLQKRIDEVSGSKGDKEPEGAVAKDYGKASNMAVEFFASSVVVATGGYFLDSWLDTSPLLFILGFLLGFAAGVYQLLRTAGKNTGDIHK